MSQSQLQSIARCLAAAGYVKHPEQEGFLLLFVEAQESGNLFYRHWTGGTSFDGEGFVTENVRPNSPAAYLITPASKYIICISSSSILQILEYTPYMDEWDTKTIPRHEVHRNGKFAAFARTDGLPDVFFQDLWKRLIYFNMTSGESVVLPASLAAGSPIFVDVFNGRMYIFYVSAKDHYIHYVTQRSDGGYRDNIMTECEVKGDLKQLSVVQNRQSGAFDGYVLTEKHVLLYITVDRQKVVLGRVDADGNFESRRIVDRYCNDALHGTLTMDRLRNYLENDPSIINAPGGEYNVTALAGACSSGHFDVVELLLAHGAEPNALSPKKRTPLFYATSISPPHSRHAIVCALLDAGADVDEYYGEDNYNTPLMNAITMISDKEVVHELLKRGASLTATNAQGLTAEMMAKGTRLDLRRLQSMQLQCQPQPRPQLRPPRENIESSEFQRQLMEFVVALVMLLVTYTNSQDVLDDILTNLKGIDGSASET